MRDVACAVVVFVVTLVVCTSMFHATFLAPEYAAAHTYHGPVVFVVNQSIDAVQTLRHAIPDAVHRLRGFGRA